jgi:hypothetical protein
LDVRHSLILTTILEALIITGYSKDNILRISLTVGFASRPASQCIFSS